MRSPKPLHPTHTLRLPPGAVIKMFLLASISVVASVWALVRFYTHPHLPMVVPASNEVTTGSARDASATEIPAPDLEPIH